MDWLITQLSENNSLIGASLTFLLSIFGAKKLISGKINILFSIAKETLDVIIVLSKALKPDSDGKIRIEKEELSEIRKELTDMKKAMDKALALK
ncbi:hypothetical protein ACFL6O_06610 [candidate division KSB1 bacterium]